MEHDTEKVAESVDGVGGVYGETRVSELSE